MYRDSAYRKKINHNIVCTVILFIMMLSFTNSNTTSGATDNYYFSNTSYMDQWVYEKGYNSTVKKGHISEDNFTLLGIHMNVNNLDSVKSALGENIVYEQSETSVSGPEQICYKSEGSNDHTTVIFGSDIFGSRRINQIILGTSEGNIDPNLSYCKSNSLINSDLATASGIRLGISIEQLNKIIGKKPIHTHGLYEYAYKTVNRLRKSDVPQVFAEGVTLSELVEDVREMGCVWHYDRISIIHARFRNNKLTWILLMVENVGTCVKVQ